ncbi:MAG: hypothetical protein HON90_17150 [Halobacteriovoraceae bacterium]|nr:hypothetical protein [Halobacteriovoraceae bacterium]
MAEKERLKLHINILKENPKRLEMIKEEYQSYIKKSPAELKELSETERDLYKDLEYFIEYFDKYSPLFSNIDGFSLSKDHKKFTKDPESKYYDKKITPKIDGEYFFYTGKASQMNSKRRGEASIRHITVDFNRKNQPRSITQSSKHRTYYNDDLTKVSSLKFDLNNNVRSLTECEFLSNADSKCLTYTLKSCQKALLAKGKLEKKVKECAKSFAEITQEVLQVDTKLIEEVLTEVRTKHLMSLPKNTNNLNYEKKSVKIDSFLESAPELVKYINLCKLYMPSFRKQIVLEPVNAIKKSNALGKF